MQSIPKTFLNGMDDEENKSTGNVLISVELVNHWFTSMVKVFASVRHEMRRAVGFGD